MGLNKRNDGVKISPSISEDRITAIAGERQQSIETAGVNNDDSCDLKDNSVFRKVLERHLAGDITARWLLHRLLCDDLGGWLDNNFHLAGKERQLIPSEIKEAGVLIEAICSQAMKGPLDPGTLQKQVRNEGYRRFNKRYKLVGHGLGNPHVGITATGPKLSEEKTELILAIVNSQKSLLGAATRMLREMNITSLSGDDVFQEAVSRILKGSAVKFQGEVKAVALAKKIMKNVVIDHWRKYKKHDSSFLLIELEHRFAADLPSQVTDHDGVRLLMTELVKQIEEIYPEVFALRAPIMEPLDSALPEVPDKREAYLNNLTSRHFSGDASAEPFLRSYLRDQLTEWLDENFRVERDEERVTPMTLEGADNLVDHLVNQALEGRQGVAKSVLERLRNEGYRLFNKRFKLVSHGLDADEKNPVKVAVKPESRLADPLFRQALIDKLLADHALEVCAFAAKSHGIPATDFAVPLGIGNNKASSLVNRGADRIQKMLLDALKA